MEYLKGLEDNAFELAICDPPYGIGWDGEDSMAENNSKKWNSAKKTGYKKKEWDSDRPNKDYFIELERVSKNQIIWGANYFSDYLKPTGGWIVWEKGVPDDMTLSQGELAYNTCFNSLRIHKLLWAGFRKCESSQRIHPTQKPVKLYEWLLANYAKEGDKILDTHLGSGSSAIAAHYGGFDFVGCELDEDYFKAASERIDRETAQIDMF
jgi:site-specific DNA-methyltransferase (adenine-specific)